MVYHARKDELWIDPPEIVVEDERDWGKPIRQRRAWKKLYKRLGRNFVVFFPRLPLAFRSPRDFTHSSGNFQKPARYILCDWGIEIHSEEWVHLKLLAQDFGRWAVSQWWRTYPTLRTKKPKREYRAMPRHRRALLRLGNWYYERGLSWLGIARRIEILVAKRQKRMIDPSRVDVEKCRKAVVKYRARVIRKRPLRNPPKRLVSLEKAIEKRWMRETKQSENNYSVSRKYVKSQLKAFHAREEARDRLRVFIARRKRKKRAGTLVPEFIDLELNRETDPDNPGGN